MGRRFLLDTGPIVALYDRNDQFHAQCLELSKSLSGEALTCWPVVTEAIYLLRNSAESIHHLLTRIADRELGILSIDADDAIAVRDIRAKYAVDFADACLMHLSDRENLDEVFTLDYRHFPVYRRATGGALRIIR
jgi:predicted nucleic acid-binding protein